MSQQINAIYDNGVLKPLEPLDLKDQELVILSIEKLAANQHELEDEYVSLMADDGDSDISWETVRAVLAKLPSSLTEDFDQARDERF